MIPEIKISEYTYNLEQNRIATYPLPERDASKLLIYRNGEIGESIFRNIPDFLPYDDSLMVFNNTMVVPARLHFRRETGANIEVFCLEPVAPADYERIFASTESCRWKCVIGNSKRWKEDVLKIYIPDDASEELKALQLTAKLIERNGQTGIVELSWKDGRPFSSVLEICGTVPIPPYLNRESEEIDKTRYQTAYAKYCGSVAAPTAGLHFTNEVMERIREKGIQEKTVHLHVGAGTFLPVKSETIQGHEMHREPFSVSKEILRELISGKKNIIAVGTTSVRTLESLYYIGVSCIEKGHPEDVEQWAPYTREYPYTTEEALQAIIDYLDENKLENIVAGTRIIIVPGFRYRLVNVLVTNYHQPESTLILLVAAFVGEDWRKIYEYALKNQFRFLSYGDSSLLFRNDGVVNR